MARGRSGKVEKRDAPLVRYCFYIALIALFLIALYSVYTFINGTLGATTANAIFDIALEMIFSITVFSYLLLRGWNLKKIISTLGLSRDKLNRLALFFGILLLLFVVFLEAATTYISQTTGVQLPTNVEQVLGSEPLYLLLFAAFIAPINEEILFRGFLVPRIGIVISALIFAFFHAGYMSISELVAAFLFGIAAGLVYRRTGSLYSTIIGHMLVNIMTVAILIYVGSGGLV